MVLEIHSSIASTGPVLSAEMLSVRSLHFLLYIEALDEAGVL